MRKQWSKYALLGAMSMMLAFSACNKKDAEPAMDAENTQSFEDNTYAENEFDAVTDMENAMSESAFSSGRPNLTDGELIPLGGAGDSISNKCAVVTIEAWTPQGSNLQGRKVTIDFGTTGCLSKDGKRMYKGKIITHLNKRLKFPGAYAKTTFENFYAKRANEPDTKYVQLLATKVVTNESAASPNNPELAVAPIKHRIKVFGAGVAEYSADSYAKLQTTDNKSIEWNTNRLRTWSEGFATHFIFADDVFLISGTHKGKNMNGTMYQAQTVEGSPLQFKTVCLMLGIFRPTKGKLQLQSTNHPTVVLDFGDGSCDNEYTITQ